MYKMVIELKMVMACLGIKILNSGKESCLEKSH